MFKVKNRKGPNIFKSQFEEIDHHYKTRYSFNSYKISKASLKTKRLSISYRGPYLWNSILNKNLKLPRTLNSFKRLLKSHLFELDLNDKIYF